MNCGIILGGGIGSRANLGKPKQYETIIDKPMIEYSIDAFEKSDSIDKILIVCESEESAARISDTYGIDTIVGGSTRNESFYKALAHLSDTGCKKVFVNEAARPMISETIIEDMFSLGRDYDCVYCIKPITDSLEGTDGRFKDRTQFQLVMSPELYTYDVICKYFTVDSKTTFPGHTLPESVPKIGYTKYINNYKLTFQEDLILIRAMKAGIR